MKRIVLLLLIATMMTASMVSCRETLVNTDSHTTSSTDVATTTKNLNPMNSTNATSTSVPSTTTTPFIDGPNTIPPTTELETAPDQLPGNPEKYSFTMLPYVDPDTWFGFDEKEHWSFWYTTQTNIGNTLDLSLLNPCQYDEAIRNWIPSADAYEQGWRQDNDEYATLTPITDKSAVMAFTAPEAGCYEFEFYIQAGKVAGTDSDGVQFLLFGEDLLVYSIVCDRSENEALNDPYIIKHISLDKGERAYFIADPRSNGVGDICKSISMIRVQRQINQYVDNKDVFAFGYSYDNRSLKQGTNGWHAGYLDTDTPLAPSSMGTTLIPRDMASGVIFNYGDVGDPDQKGAILWTAPEDGHYVVSVKGWWNDSGVLISFYNNGELITALNDTFFSGTYQMTCTLKKGEHYAVVFQHSETPNQDTINELQILIQRVLSGDQILL